MMPQRPLPAAAALRHPYFLSVSLMRLTFLGATQTVTGSKYLLESGSRRVLVDCGLFQGLKELRLRNWEEPPVDPASLDAVILTHAHIDHTGYLPRLIRQGFKGPVYGTPATLDLCRILLPDAGHLQEEEARFCNKHHRTKHKEALPLYTVDDAHAVLERLEPVGYRRSYQALPGLTFEMSPAGHILGSAFIRFTEGKGSTATTLLVTGDIGRYNQPIIPDPTAVTSADYLVLESTYGNRLHDDKEGKLGKDQLRDIVVKTADRGGIVLIPSFAVGRAQEVLFTLRELEDDNQIPILPVYLDSPMAVDAFEIYRDHTEEHDVEMKRLASEGVRPLYTRNVQFTRSVPESKAINDQNHPAIIISANGMATGGRILHHMMNRLPDSRNSIVFVGFQAVGTRGRTMVDGAQRIRIFGVDYPVRAQVHSVSSFSAHGDYSEILRWLEGFRAPPGKTFLVHGEPKAIQGMKERIAETFPAWQVEAPTYLQSFDL
jgi:metallo-beta-lactamase family protein